MVAYVPYTAPVGVAEGRPFAVLPAVILNRVLVANMGRVESGGPVADVRGLA